VDGATGERDVPAQCQLVYEWFTIRYAMKVWTVPRTNRTNSEARLSIDPLHIHEIEIPTTTRSHLIHTER
jgi:hypothetical protein